MYKNLPISSIDTKLNVKTRWFEINHVEKKITDCSNQMCDGCLYINEESVIDILNLEKK